MDVAIIRGSDFGAMGNDASKEIHSIFRWITSKVKRMNFLQSRRRGIMLVIEEAETILHDRAVGKRLEWRVGALNALLYHTGTPSFVASLVLVTNRPMTLTKLF